MSHGSTFESLEVRPSNPKLPVIIVVTARQQHKLHHCLSISPTFFLGKRPVLLTVDFNVQDHYQSDTNAQSFLDISIRLSSVARK